MIVIPFLFALLAVAPHADALDAASFVPKYVEPWPASVAALPTAPKPCMLKGDCYAEPRNFIEAQWHESRSGDLDEARHLHYGCAAPFHVRGVLRLDCRIIAFHFQGAVFESVRKAMIRGHSLPKLISSPYRADKPGLFRVPITEHVQEFYVSIYLDTSAAIYDGPARFETDASIKVPTGTTWRMHNVRLQFGVYLANGGGRLLKSFGGGAAVEGWISTTETEGSPFGYLRLSVPAVRRFASEPIEEVTIKPRPAQASAVLWIGSVSRDTATDESHHAPTDGRSDVPGTLARGRRPIVLSLGGHDTGSRVRHRRRRSRPAGGDARQGLTEIAPHTGTQSKAVCSRCPCASVPR
jgi:hypothetical protein